MCLLLNNSQGRTFCAEECENHCGDNFTTKRKRNTFVNTEMDETQQRSITPAAEAAADSIASMSMRVAWIAFFGKEINILKKKI